MLIRRYHSGKNATAKLNQNVVVSGCRSHSMGFSELNSIQHLHFVAGNIFSWKEGISKNLVLMIFTGVAAYIVLIGIELGGLRLVRQLIFRYMKRSYPDNGPETEDDDVAAEKDRINNMSPQELQSETMVMQNVSKFYGKFCAVNKISVAIKRYILFIQLNHSISLV